MSLEAVKRNGHNIDLGWFDTVGEYGIPVIQPIHLEQKYLWLRFNQSLTEKKKSEFGVHFYIDDYLFERAWHDPSRYALFLRQFPVVTSPDFSMFRDWPKAVCVYNHWRKHQLAAYWQKCGIPVVPSIGWIDRDSYSWCFDGEPEGGTVSVSSVGTQRNKDARKMFIAGYNEMLTRLQPEKIIFFGMLPDECKGNIEYHEPFYEIRRKYISFADNVT